MPGKHVRIGFQKPLLAIVMAGGRGERLGPLTECRCKPEMPFAKNRLIDFALANVINSQIINHTMILTQYMQQGLIAHLSTYDLTSHVWGKMVNIVPAQKQHDDDSWYDGTANAVYQNRKMIRDDPADIVVILAADHIYKLDIRQMLAFHLEQKAEFTVCGLTVPPAVASGNFGVMELNSDSRIVGFEEKPLVPKPLPESPELCFASMGIYMVNKAFLLDLLDADHVREQSEHDFGKNIIPHIIAKGGALYGYDYNENVIPGEMHVRDEKGTLVRYWRDVGRIGPYWEAVMDLTEVVPMINLYNTNWPVPTAWDRLPPAKFVNPDKQPMRSLANTLVAGGCIVDDNTSLNHVVLSRNVRIQKHVALERVVVFDGVTIGPRVQIQNAIVEEGAIIPADVRIGYDIDEDIRNGVYVDEKHDALAGYPPIRVVTKESFMK